MELDHAVGPCGTVTGGLPGPRMHRLILVGVGWFLVTPTAILKGKRGVSMGKLGMSMAIIYYCTT